MVSWPGNAPLTPVRLEPIIFELERCQEDLLIIGHASVIRCLLAYLVGLPPSEVPAVEIARGDLVEVTPASYGVVSRAFHFWSGEGRGDSAGRNLYENFAEAASGIGGVLPTFAGEAENIEREAEEEEAKDKQLKADLVRAKLKSRLESGTNDGWRSAPYGKNGGASPAEPVSAAESTTESAITDGNIDEEELPSVRERASESCESTKSMSRVVHPLLPLLTTTPSVHPQDLTPRHPRPQDKTTRRMTERLYEL